MSKYAQAESHIQEDQHGLSLAVSLYRARKAFIKKYDREPNMDILMFRGGFSTTSVVVEIWEEE